MLLCHNQILRGMSKMKKCIVLFSDKAYLNKAINTIKQIRKIGKYKGDLVYFHGNDVSKDDLKLFSKLNVIPKYFPDIQFDKKTLLKLSQQSIFRKKRIMLHKIHIFQPYFKNWDRVFYIDAGASIQKRLDPFFKLDCTDKLLANSDAQPTYVWKLYDQFDKTTYPLIYEKLRNDFNLEIDYFQATIMMYDTNIIKEDTFSTLLNLVSKYPLCNTVDQGILNLYFNGLYHYWKQIPLKYKKKKYLYDFRIRENRKRKDYIILKRPHLNISAGKQ